MANVKITQLPLATTPLTGTEDIPLVQGTTTKQVTVTGLFTSPVMTNPTLGTVGQADLINATGLPISTGVAGLGTGVATFLGTPSSANLRTAVTDETGTGSLVFATSPTLVTPNLGTPSVLVATNATGTAVGLTAGSAITNANLTGAVTSVGNATSLGSFTSAQLRTALTDETGSGSAVFATSPTITAPILNQINDTNNAQILGLSPTTSAVDYLVVKNGIGVGVPLHFYADGSSANIGLHIQPKGTGLVTISDGTDFNKGIRFRSSGSAASAVTLLDAVSTAGRVVTLPDATTTLVGRDTTDTLTNKTIAFSSNTFSGTLAIANGGTNASTAASAIENLLPAYTGNGSKGLKLNSGATALEWVADGGGTVTSVAATVPSFLSIAGSPITTSGTLAISLSGTALPTTSGGTGLTSFTSGGVVYASSSSALATGSALTFDGTFLTASRGITVNNSGIATSGFYNGVAISGYDALGWSGSSTLALGGYRASQWTQLEFYTGGSTGLTLTNSSLYTASGINVGFGTSSPSTKLDIKKDSATAYNPSTAAFNTILNISNTTSGASTNALMSFTTESNGEWYIGGVQNAGNNAADFIWASRNAGARAERMRILANGYVGIGGSSDEILRITGSSDGNSRLRLYNQGTEMGALGSQTGYFGSGGANQLLLYGSTGLTVASNSALIFMAGGATERMRLDTSGNLGLGVTPSAWNFGKSMQIGALDGITLFGYSNGCEFGNNFYYNSSYLYGASGPATRYTSGSGKHAWYIAPSGTAGNAITFTNAMTLDASGHLQVGTTSAGGYRFNVHATDTYAANFRTTTSLYSATFQNTGTGSQTYVGFSLNGGGSETGTITTNGTITIYNTTSDYRLKTVIGAVTGQGARIDALEPIEYTWNSTGSRTRGFLAHKFQEVYADSVSGTKDAVDADGNPKYQAMQAGTSEVIADLVAEIQSLRQRLSAANL